MLYKFKSKAAADVIMTSAHGDQVLRLLGREPSAKGILEPADMPAALKALEQAVAQDDEARRQAEAEAAAEGRELPPSEGVSLRQRVWPLVDAIKRSMQADTPLVWGL